MADQDDDEAALTWAGDEARGRARPVVPDAERAAAETTREADPSPSSPGRSGTGRRVVAVLFGVLYAAWTVGWVIGLQTLSAGTGDLFAQITWQFGEFLAMLAPALWFAATLRLAPPRAGWAWLLAGAVVLVPWPLLLWWLP